ncbi:MAG: hypothetical protein GY772_28120 [bacterium]|nr:hypothetical protein [bacterium]MCP4244427.1 hypothetical protein [bacterium]MCP4593410.1 hypothetical protein [bacterium]
MSWSDNIGDLVRSLPKARVKPRTCIYLQDKATGDDVEIVSENLEVKAEPVKEKTRGNQ